MTYVGLQLALMLITELLIIRSYVTCLTMRSTLIYVVLHLSCFATGAAIRILGAAPLLRTLIVPLCYLIFPLALSVGPLRTRILRISLVVLASFGTEILGVVIYTLLTGGTMAENTASQGNIASIVTIYCILIPITALSQELVIATCRRVDRHDDARLEIPIVVLMLSAALYFFLIYMRFFTNNSMAAPIAFLSLAYCMLSIGISFALLAVARRDAQIKRTITDQLSEARQAKHLKGVVEVLAQRSTDLRRLRHDLANQVRVVKDLADHGHLDDADRYLEALQDQAREVQRGSGNSL